MSNTTNTSKSQSTRKTTERKRTSGSSSSTGSSRSGRSSAESAPSEQDGGGTARRRPGAMEVLRHARAQFTELTGMTPESVTSFERDEDGWTLEIEVLELERVPDTMSLIASYEVALDPDGELTGYHRLRRYERGRADPHRSGGR